jgi:nucleoside-diphosphate-sugar epimerase
MRVFLTGATGFIGRHFLHQLTGSRIASVVCLVRDPEHLRALAPSELPLTAVSGALEEPATYVEALARCDVVCHLAALTGNARAAAHDAVNAEGTRTLVEAARGAGVPRFLHVSTIAVRYPERERYPYARAKESAERIVRGSGLDFAIVRPTIVLGSGSPIGQNLLALARAPVTPMFGDGRTKVQPVDVTDVAACLIALMERESLGGGTYELGGADVLTFDELLGEICREARGREPRIVHLPVDLIIGVLRLAERLSPFPLPVGSGQFYAFRYDNDAAPAPLLDRLLPRRRGIDEMVSDLVGGIAAPAASVPLATTAPPSEEAAADTEQLDAECRVFCRYLIGEEPSEYVLAKYRGAHQPGATGPLRQGVESGRSLVAFARRGPRAARLADSFAVLFARAGVLRRKLTLLLAILESMAPTAVIVDTADRGSVVGFVLGAIVRGVAFAGRVLVAALVCGPRFLAERRGRGEGATWSG